MAERRGGTADPKRRRVNSERSGRRRYVDPYERRRRPVSEQTKKNRARAVSMSAGYVLALAVACIVTLFFCIHYLQLRSREIHQAEKIAEMETTLSRLKADNDAYENKALASVDMEDVKKTALHELGLHYATESQIRYYNADDESYVRQYEQVPEN